MSEQQKQLHAGRIIITSAIILAVVVILPGCKKKPAEPTQTEHHQSDPTQSEPTSESAKTDTKPAAAPKISLNDIIKAARSWGPAYQSWYGKTAPDFTLTDITGKQHRLSDYRGKDVLLVFWATWCRYCILEIPHLIELRNTVSEDKLAILAISNEKPDLVKKFAADKKMNYTVLLEQRNMPNPFGVMRIFQTAGIPCSFFIDPEGKIKLATAGMLSLDSIKAILQAEPL